MNLDSIDISILKELNKDGRASFRQIARRTLLSTPTISSRIERMKRAGLIRSFTPVYNLDATENSGVSVLVTLSAPPSKTTQIAKDLGNMPEVFGLFIISAQNNLIARVNLPNLRELQQFLTSASLRKLGAEVIGSQIITETVKDEHPLPFANSLQLNLRCDFCKGQISTSRPYSINVASRKYYFCCKICRKSYLEKYGQKINRINAHIVS